jgi:glycosyltransferase involved in cell wall biosynthesis
MPAVLHVCTRYLRGASERRLLDLMRAMPDADHHLVVGGDSWPALAEARVPAASITVEPTLVRRISLIDDTRAVLKVARTIRRIRPDLVVTHQSKSGVVGRVAVLLAGRPPTVHVLSMASPGEGSSGRRASRAFGVVERVLEPVTTRYATVGSDLADRYVEVGIPREKIHVVRSGVDVGPRPAPAAVRQRVIERYGLPSDRPLVMSISSLEARNGTWRLPELALRWRGLDPRPFLVVAGSGPLDGPVRRLLHEAGLAGDAAVVGHVEDERELVAAADAVVALFRDGGLPEVLVHAAVSGVPFVAYDVDGAGELVLMGAAGVVVPVGDVTAASDAVATLVRGRRRARPLDPSPWSSLVVEAGFRDLVAEALAS